MQRTVPISSMPQMSPLATAKKFLPGPRAETARRIHKQREISHEKSQKAQRGRAATKSPRKGRKEFSQGCADCCVPLEDSPDKMHPDGMHGFPRSPSGCGRIGGFYSQGYAQNAYPWLRSWHAFGVRLENLVKKTRSYELDTQRHKGTRRD